MSSALKIVLLASLSEIVSYVFSYEIYAGKCEAAVGTSDQFHAEHYGFSDWTALSCIISKFITLCFLVFLAEESILYSLPFFPFMLISMHFCSVLAYSAIMDGQRKFKFSGEILCS